KKLITFVAPPGYSEHHTGRAVDFVPSEARFAYSKIYKWLKNNAAEFGFFETFPEDTTGLVPWESWHWVYISK
ncbi:MAG TPA: D-alanyl-D-alanine carboxypeptidase family protein, partial [candidate division Zixibacteria bacterium]|nr:D-alanyl-D-alanine carboxypeptidase family protein [candidate division Zixibacteria bacterium]